MDRSHGSSMGDTKIGDLLAVMPPTAGKQPRCSYITKGGKQCRSSSMRGAIVCRTHMSKQDKEKLKQAADQILEETRVQLRNMMQTAVATYWDVLKNSKNDIARLRAADKVLELSGYEPPPKQVEVKVGFDPTDQRDVKLISILEKVSADRAALLRNRSIDADSRPVVAPTEPSSTPETSPAPVDNPTVQPPAGEADRVDLVVETDVEDEPTWRPDPRYGSWTA